MLTTSQIPSHDHGMQASNGEFLCDMAAADLGIAMQPTFIAHAAIRSGAVKPILTDFDWPVTPGYAVYPPTRHLSHRVREFIDYLAEHFRGTAPWDADCEKIIAQTRAARRRDRK